jgi:hypothetical protein
VRDYRAANLRAARSASTPGASCGLSLGCGPPLATVELGGECTRLGDCGRTLAVLVALVAVTAFWSLVP